MHRDTLVGIVLSRKNALAIIAALKGKFLSPNAENVKINYFKQAYLS